MSVFDELKKRLKNYFSDKNTTTKKSSKWKEYHLGVTLTHCPTCFKRNNKIYLITEEPVLPEHQKCACFLTWLRMIMVGDATKLGHSGADYYVNKYGVYPIII